MPDKCSSAETSLSGVRRRFHVFILEWNDFLYYYFLNICLSHY